LPRSSRRAASRTPHAHEPSASESPPWYRRAVPWWALVVTLVVLITAAFAVDPLRDAATLQPVLEARLELPSSYVALAPLSNVLDTITLLSVGQHIALVLWVIGVFVVIRVALARMRRRLRPAREALAAVWLLVGIVIVYALAALAPRPMARIAIAEPTILAIDFHSHTHFSHDGRSGWTEEDVRDWHRASGFDVAYITDHATYSGAERGIAANPTEAGEGTMILQGLEAYYKGEHVNVLSAGRTYHGLTTPDLTTLDTLSVALASLIVPASPVMIETIPGNLAHVVAADTGSRAPARAGVRAIEVVDGSPRGLSQGRRDRVRIVGMADSLDLALVAGSDNHGWGRAAPGWTLLRVTGWRGMTSDSLSRRIEQVLRLGRRKATKVVERRVANGTNPLALAFAGPVIAWRMCTALSPDERVLWLLWTWVIVLLWRGVRVYRARPPRTA
jgi:hypothetical protein